MADDLYERDILAWSELQAEALRSRAAGHNRLDYDNLAEEIEDVGRSILHACESDLDNIVKHLLKIEFVGPAETIPHWQGEIDEFRRHLARRLTTTIRNRLESELDTTCGAVIKELRRRKLLSDQLAVHARLRGYNWDEITDPDYFPEPIYESASTLRSSSQ